MDYDLFIAGIMVGAAGAIGVFGLAIVVREVSADRRERVESEERQEAAWRRVAREMESSHE